MNFRSIGDLRHRLVLEEPQRVDDGAGGADTSWVAVDTIWAGVMTSRGSEGVRSGRVSGSVSHEVTIRYRDDVKPSMRFVLGSQVFDIVAVLYPTDQKRWLKCLCVERNL